MSRAAASPVRREQGTVKWLAHKNFGFVNNVIVLSHSFMCNVEPSNGMVIEYEPVEGKKGFSAGNALPLIGGVPMGERVNIADTFDLDAEVDRTQR